MHTPETQFPAGSDAIATADVRRQLMLLWTHRVMILIVALMFGAAGAVFSLARTRQFESSATVSVSAFRLADQTPGRVAPEAFVPLMTTPAVAARVVQELKLDGVSVDELLKVIVTVRGVPDSSFIKVVARMDEANKAAAVANSFAAHGVTAATRASQLDVDALHDELRRMLDEATVRLRAAEKAYDDYRVTARVEMLQREVDTLVSQRGQLMDVIVELQGQRARLVRLDGDLASRDRVTSLRQGIVDDPALSEVARNTPTAPRDLLNLQMTRETSNAVFANLDEEAVRTRAHVAFLEQQQARLAAAAGVDGAQLTKLTQLYERQSVLEALDSERRLARKSYENVADKFQGARLAAIGRTPHLLVVDPAIAPESALGRYLVRNTLLGLAVGILLGCVGVMVRHALAGQPRT